MSTLPKLVTAIAEVDGRDRATIDHYARTIREAGYIPTTKRGVGASRMTASAAANLLVALCGADSAKDSPIAIDRFRSLENSFGKSLGECTQLPAVFNDLLKVQSFGKAIEYLIENVPELLAYIYTAYTLAYRGSLRSALNLQIYDIRIVFRRYVGEIVLFHRTGGEDVVDYKVLYLQDIDRTAQGFYGPDQTDRRVSVEIGLRSLIAAWRVVHPDAELCGVDDEEAA